jgi:biopolymer transport protein ExbD
MIRTLEILMVLLAIAITTTQIFIPLAKGTPFFPMFSRKRKEAMSVSVGLAEKLELAETEVEQKRLEKQINEVKKNNK